MTALLASAGLAADVWLVPCGLLIAWGLWIAVRSW